MPDLIGDLTKAALAADKARGLRLGNPNGARALRGKRVGNNEAVASIKAHAQERAENLRAIIADVCSAGHASVRDIAAELNRRAS